KLVFGVMEHQTEIDENIKVHLEKWTLERLANVDRSLLRMAIFEMKYCSDEVPVNVILDEAIEIAKMYGDDQSSRFINGVLAKIKLQMS
ncbi:MAG TPA: transcription antitermination factor NusB, partial [Pseudoneobacillus sp.]|nr:transcription antitermination factor NusB [Pseudoneobacillus sp.]